jgi:hypothetical protein
MLKLQPKMSGTGKNGKPYFAYTVVGSQSEIEEYILVVTTCEEYKQSADRVLGEDGKPTMFTNKLVAPTNNEVFLSPTYGAYTKNPTKKALARIAQEIDQAETSGNSTRALEKKEDKYIDIDMQEEIDAQAAMDKAMSDYRNSNNSASDEDENDDVTEGETASEESAPKNKSKAKAKVSAGDDEDLI